MNGTAYRETLYAYLSKITNAYVPDSCCYSDAWFADTTAAQNDALALLSAQLSAAATNEPGYVIAALEGLGFTVTAYDYGGADFGQTAFTVGKKTIPGEKQLAVAVVQSDLYGERGWLQNVTVNADNAPNPDDHAAFSAAASYLLETLGADGCDVLWFAGSSRGGAIANLAAAYAIDTLPGKRVFAYTFEAPATTASGEAKDAKYAGIYNYAADDDPVTLLPLAGWSMTRYGTDVFYNREVSFEETMEAMRVLNPDAASYYLDGDSPNYSESYAAGKKAEALARIVGTLTATVPERAAYTAPNADPQEEFNGYTYQEGLGTLISFVFGGDSSLDDVKEELVENLLNELLYGEDGMDPLIALLTELIYARMADLAAAAADGQTKAVLTQLASGHYGNLTETLLGLAGSRAAYVGPKGVYALLRLLVPLLVDPILPEADSLPAFEDFLQYNLDNYFDIDVDVPSRDLFSRLLAFAGNVPTLVFSHQPDVILARMKTLAPAPDADDLVLQIDEPQVGDATGSLKDDIADALDPAFTWLEVTGATWRTADETLANDRAYYLDATLALTGRSLPDGFSATLNGREFSHRKVWHEGGRLFVSGTWLFVFGDTPATATVRFDTGGVWPAPADMEVPVDTAFADLDDAPADPGLVKEEGNAWSMRFDGWFDENGTPWDELYTLCDMTVHAEWSMLIDEIHVTYAIPREGDTGSALFRLSAPEGVPYSIREMTLYGGAFYYYFDPEEPEAVVPEEGVEEWTLDFIVHASSTEVDFLLDEDGVFVGTVTVNGEPVDAGEIWYDPAWYNEFDDVMHPATLHADFTFTFRAADEPEPDLPPLPGPRADFGNLMPALRDLLDYRNKLLSKSEKTAETDDTGSAADAEEKSDPVPVRRRS